ncbi:hypothetical protein BN871_CK_00060 [Paenibacillus sp. P22]|nr:hypothetical protein BN871_CK_00060 [Paenibacillus sp. P22]
MVRLMLITLSAMVMLAGSGLIMYESINSTRSMIIAEQAREQR